VKNSSPCYLSQAEIQTLNRLTFQGIAEYIIGKSNLDIFDKQHPNEFQLVAVEAACILDRGSFWQCIAEAAALHTMRKERVPDTGRTRGILSDAEHWTFIRIDNHNLLWTFKYQTVFGIMKSCQPLQ
jgi:hypothetical protein